ncbi:MAG: pyruvate ferredoxin oxidoreductase [Candidatus Tectomicrobia bacterium RIFCSPLOWO2_12_FULL_69_37]|nr:MAG: pyruvate ferredoxin oxidoreductase [Candidatus Tectomicrobia bacterium RIFCSPLOWO2_02_FULL_70_19]OGL68169.1 MAG: pyruvate ferredoxin oxidoreductase [Candidatus Tectomicrobia bacterium RIFCSPLOWO2_12_FULL_69_37]
MATAAQQAGVGVQLLTGSEVMANVVRLADVDVITAYPIRPYDTVMQYVSRFISNGEFDADYIPAESEHGQFEIVKHACACGARVFTGSSGVGWLYAMEPLAVTAGLRLPMVALVGCRALDDPGAFGTEHNDAMLVRDLGWLITFPDAAQEVVELGLLAYRVAEDPKVFLPCAIAMDGAFLTHSQATVRLPSQEQVKKFLPPYNRGDMLLHPDNPITIAPQANEDWLMEVRRQSSEAAKRAYTVLKDAHKDFCRIFGESTNPFLDEYMTEDADVVLCGLGTLSLPVKVAIREMRKEGKKVGLVRLKWFRPFPTEELRASLSRFKAVGVVDRDYSFGSPFHGGILLNEVKAALYGLDKQPRVKGFVCGLGGREVLLENVKHMADEILAIAKSGKADTQVEWIGVRG